MGVPTLLLVLISGLAAVGQHGKTDLFPEADGTNTFRGGVFPVGLGRYRVYIET